MLSEPGAMRHDGIIVGIEFTMAAVGALALVFSGHSPYIAVWIAAVVGLRGSITPRAITGAICGCALIVGAAVPLVRHYGP